MTKYVDGFVLVVPKNKVAEYKRQGDDTIYVFDSSKRNFILLRNIDDIESGNDFVLRIQSSGRNLNDIVNLIDIDLREGNIKRNQYDSITLSDAISRIGSFNRDNPDTFAIVDSTSRNIIVLRNLNDIVFLKDDQGRIFIGYRTNSDTITVSDQNGKLYKAIRIENDLATVLDQTTKNSIQNRNPTDTIILTDENGRTIQIFRIPQDQILATDQVNRLYVGIKDIADISKIEDFLQSLENSLRSGTDIIYITDSGLKNTIQIRNQEDIENLRDTINRLANLNRDISDVVIITFDLIGENITAVVEIPVSQIGSAGGGGALQACQINYKPTSFNLTIEKNNLTFKFEVFNNGSISRDLAIGFAGTRIPDVFDSTPIPGEWLLFLPRHTGLNATERKNLSVEFRPQDTVGGQKYTGIIALYCENKIDYISLIFTAKKYPIAELTAINLSRDIEVGVFSVPRWLVFIVSITGFCILLYRRKKDQSIIELLLMASLLTVTVLIFF